MVNIKIKTGDRKMDIQIRAYKEHDIPEMMKI
jgi:hypothetical protein